MAVVISVAAVLPVTIEDYVMDNEVFLLIAGYFFFNCAMIAMHNDTDLWKRLSIRDLPYNGWLYMIDCIAFDIFIVAYFWTQWSGI